MKKLSSDERSAAALQTLIDFVAAHHGNLKKVTDDLEARTGEKQYARNVGQWLDPDPATRIQPRLGIGLALIECAEIVAKNGKPRRQKKVLAIRA